MDNCLSKLEFPYSRILPTFGLQLFRCSNNYFHQQMTKECIDDPVNHLPYSKFSFFFATQTQLLFRCSHMLYWHPFLIKKWLVLANPDGPFLWVWAFYPVRCEEKSGNSLLLLLKESWRRDSPLLPDTVMPAWQKALESSCNQEES